MLKDTREYLKLAEKASGKINKPVGFDYIWGDFLKELKKFNPEIRIINLETTITQIEDFYPKGINYRMNPKNIEVLNLLKNKNYLICNLANNHILDFGPEGLIETIETLKRNKIHFVGAEENIDEAKKPLRIKNVLIFAYGHISSGTLALFTGDLIGHMKLVKKKEILLIS